VRQKESLGEYGSGWGWETTSAIRVLDQSNARGDQIIIDGTKIFSCEDTYLVDGEMLYSKSQMLHQSTCLPSVKNGGNYYKWYVSMVKGSNTNSICAKNWTIPSNQSYESLGYYELLYNYYSLTNSTAKQIVNAPLSYIYGGYVDHSGPMINRGSEGKYGVNKETHSSSYSHNEFSFSVNSFSIFSSSYSNFQRYHGRSLRCGASGFWRSR